MAPETSYVEGKNFWLVWSNPWPKDGLKHLPGFRHGSYADARREAERLAALNPNVKFYVLKAETEVVAEMRLQINAISY